MKAANDNRDDKSFIYLVRSPEQDAFKVGYSSGTLRIHSLQTGNPATLVLMRQIPAEYPCESAVHVALKAYRIRGEWFHDSGLADALLDELLDAHHGADQCGRLMASEEATEATVEAIRIWAMEEAA